MNRKPDFVRWTCNGVTAVMRWDDYEANKEVFRVERGTVKINLLPFATKPRIATFSDRPLLTPWVTGSQKLLKQLLLWRTSVDRPIYVPFANGHEDAEEEFILLRSVERAFRLSGDDFIQMFDLRIPRAEDAQTDVADCGPDEPAVPVLPSATSVLRGTRPIGQPTTDQSRMRVNIRPLGPR